MTRPTRPRRFVVIPKGGLIEQASTRVQTMNLVPLAPGRASAHPALARMSRLARVPVRATPGSGGVRPSRQALNLKVVNSSPSDGAVLVEANNISIDQVRARAPAGAKVFEEQWYRLERPVRPWLRQNNSLKKPRATAGKTRTWTVTVLLDDAKRSRLKDAAVTAMIDEAKGIGVEATTDRYGRAHFELSPKIIQLEALYVEPLHGGWPVALPSVAVDSTGLVLEVPAIDLTAADVRGLVYGKPTARTGKQVKVGVVDTGVGKHKALTVAGGRNTTEESPRRYRDEDGHGSHVAGVIASTATGWRRGEASGVALYAYRIFEADDDEASTFAISAAIKQAAIDGCDLINLSIGGSMADGSVRDAIDQAWTLGCVCVAATGNDGLGEVDYPARYAKSVAVSAMGLETSWPAGAAQEWTISKWRGKTISGRESFLASFSNRGAKVALTAPGVAIVSTIFDDRWGVMNGTSMATPIATGVLARRLAASPVLTMPRDATRAAAIVALAKAHAEDLGLHAHMQGDGLAR